jgi:hypothetical protein
MSNNVEFKGGVNCYLFNSILGNKYNGYRLKISSKFDFMNANTINTNIFLRVRRENN